MLEEDINGASSCQSLLQQTLKELGIPSRPEILDQIFSETIKQDPDFRRLSQLISFDVALAAGLLKTVNSPCFGLQRKLQSPTEALMLLGLDVTRQLLAGIALHQVLTSSDPQTSKLLRWSAQVATVSAWLAKELTNEKVGPDQAYAYGLFRDCGMPIMLKRFPNYSRVLNRACAESLQEFTQVEHWGLPDFPIGHALVGCLLAQSWWLPNDICLAIHHHHEVSILTSIEEKLPLASKRLIAIGQLAEYLVQQLTGQQMTKEWLKLGQACLEILCLPADDLVFLCEGAGAVLRAVR